MALRKRADTLMFVRLVFAFSILSTISGHALKIEPWLGNVWEFEFDASYTYSRFHKVNHGVPQLHNPFNSNFLIFDLGVTPLFSLNSLPTMDFQAEVEFAATTKQDFGFQSGAFQARNQWLDDLTGDPISLMTGVIVRGVSHQSLRDVSCPYHSYANFEINSTVGKEWDSGPNWVLRTFGLLGIGNATRGYPWIRAHLAFQGNTNDTFQYHAFLRGYFGLGPKHDVHTNAFFGWAKTRHQSIDLGVAVRYMFDVWGWLEIDYAYRVYARSFPERVNFFTVTYHLPFSLF